MVACALDISGLAEAAQSRGLALVPMAQRAAPGDAAAVLAWCPRDGDPALAIADARTRGWTGPLMVAVREGCGAALAKALDAGADDAVLLPASAGEIAARLAARLRSHKPPIVLGDLVIDPVERSVTRAGRRLALLPREYALLLHLACARGCVSRAELLQSVWRLRFDPGTNVVEVHVSRLRAKLDRDAPVPMLCTERGRGYFLRV